MSDPEDDLLGALTRTTGVSPGQFGENAMRSIVRAAIRSAPDREKLLGCEGKEWLALVEAVLVPETWFFRNPEAFSAFACWLQGRPPGRPTRVLCLPCATGEEAYSIAITVIERGFEAGDLSILAGDLSTDALAKARAGEYGGHSFRGASHLMSDPRHFTRADDTTWKVSDRIRAAVAFREMNLVGRDALPRADAIFCRNALIYFSREMQDLALVRLSDALAEDGILFLGPVEQPIAQRCGFVAADYPMAFACRKASGRTPTPPQPLEAAPRKSRPIRTSPKRTHAFSDWDSNPNCPGDSMGQARKLADSGRHADAAAALDALIASDQADADTYCLAAIVREAIGDHDRAEALYRKTLYLDPSHSEALLHLALLLESDGRSVAASPLRQRAKRLIDS